MGQWAKLFMACPVPGCTNSRVTEWQAVRCGGTMYIDDDGTMECQHSGCASGPMYTWRFDCGSYSWGSPHNIGNSRFKAGDKQGFCHMFAAALSMAMLGTQGMAWVRRLMESIERFDNQGRFPKRA